MIRDVVDCDAILIRTTHHSPVCDRSRQNLKVIGRHGVGFEIIDVGAATERGIWVSITPEANYTAVAEHAIGLILAASRKVFPLSKALREGNFF
jgi:D-3-phosphoglycerate dehydrogenase